MQKNRRYTVNRRAIKIREDRKVQERERERENQKNQKTSEETLKSKLRDFSSLLV